MTTTTKPAATWWPLVAAVIVLIVVVIVAVGTTDDERAGDGGGPVVAGDALPTYDPAAPDPAAGMQIPSLLGTDLDGATINPSNNGRAKVFVFMAHWCPHCQRELPVLVDWLDRGRAGDVQVITVVTFNDPLRDNYPATSWLEGAGWPADSIMDGDANEIAMAFGLDGTPFWVLTDDEDRVVARASGELTAAQLDELVGLVASNP